MPGIPNTLPALYQRATRLGVPAYSQSNFPVIYFLQFSAKLYSLLLLHSRVNGSWVGVNGLNSGKLVSSPVKNVVMIVKVDSNGLYFGKLVSSPVRNSVTNVEIVVSLFKLPRLKWQRVKVTCVYRLLVATQVLRYTVNLIFEVQKRVFVSWKRVT